MSRVALPGPFADRYPFTEVLGEGHFGCVYLARDLRLGRTVAIKGLRFPGHDLAAQQALGTLRREALHLGTLEHPNIVRIYDWLIDGEDHYLVMQHVTGGSFDKRLERDGPLSWHLAARYIADVSSGLLAAHQKKIVHRDVKPANILWDKERDEALLGDFGVAGHLNEARSAAGTPIYMAPEAHEGGARPAQDAFSLAVTLFCFITGELPFPGPSGELRWQIQRGLQPNDPRLHDVPVPLEEVIRSGLAADPLKRPPLEEFLTRLRGTLNKLLADSLPPQSTAPSGVVSAPTSPSTPGAPVDLRLVVSRKVGTVYNPVAATHARAAPLTRNMSKVPRPPDQVRIFTGDEVMIEASANREGYVTVFNVGPEGDLNLLHADEVKAPAGTRRTIEGITMTPPAGRERVVAIWSAEPVKEPLEELNTLTATGEVPGSRQYRATRNMVRIKQSVSKLGPSKWHAVVLELDHAEK